MTAPILEKHIHKLVMDAWKRTGLPNTLVATIPNMRAAGQYGLTKGLPDLLVIGPHGAGFVELKTAKGKVSSHQEAFMAVAWHNGVAAVVTHGPDQPLAILREWGVIR